MHKPAVVTDDQVSTREQVDRLGQARLTRQAHGPAEPIARNLCSGASWLILGATQQPNLPIPICR